MSDTTGILGLGAYTPERVMTNEDWSKLVDTSDEWILTRTGIRERRFADDDQTTVDLAQAAGEAALADAGLAPDSVDELIVATDTPEVYTPDTASFLQESMGLGPIACYDLGGSGCAGFVQALDVARSRSLDGGRTVLVIGVELITRLMNWQDRNTCVLFGDGAGSAVVGPGSPLARFLAMAAGTDGSKADILTLQTGGTRQPFNLEAAQAGLHHDVVMQGREVFREAVHHMSDVSREVVEIAGLTLDDVALVIPHQANLRIIHAVGKSLDLDAERVFINVDRYGNTGSASVAIALAQARDEGRIAPGDRVLLTAFGAGFHWAATLLEFRDRDG